MSTDEGIEDNSLHEAVRYGDIDEVRQALREGLDANLIGLYQWSPLHEASNNGDLEIVKLLLKHDGKLLLSFVINRTVDCNVFTMLIFCFFSYFNINVIYDKHY